MKTLRTCIPCEKIENDSYDWYARHAAKLLEVQNKKADIIFIGDSITHFWHKEDCNGYGEEIWQEYYAHRSTLNLGYGFDRTQNMLWRIRNGELEGQNPKLVIVNAGTNQFSITQNYDGDQPQEAFAGVKLLVETLLQMLGESKIIVMAVFPRMPEEINQKINTLNALLKEHFDKKHGRIEFLDISSKFLLPDGSFNAALYVDRCCHPNKDGYRIWAEALDPRLEAENL
jgi:lysophospholipase L1-like esterase